MYTSGKVVKQELLAPGCHLLTIEQPKITAQGRPGQFVMLKAWDRNDLVLPRPFSIHRFFPKEKSFQILYKVRGTGTALMSELKSGDKVELNGPHGNGVIFPATTKAIAIVGRGLGAAPLLAILEAAKTRKYRTMTFLSAHSRKLILQEAAYRAYSDLLSIITDDHSQGLLVTDLLAKEIATNPIDTVFVCGSKRLTKAVNKLATEHGFDAYVLLEETMACGIGSCKGCVCKIKSETVPEGFVYQRVCLEGPVFPTERVIFNG